MRSMTLSDLCQEPYVTRHGDIKHTVVDCPITRIDQRQQAENKKIYLWTSVGRREEGKQ